MVSARARMLPVTMSTSSRYRRAERRAGDATGSSRVGVPNRRLEGAQDNHVDQTAACGSGAWDRRSGTVDVETAFSRIGGLEPRGPFDPISPSVAAPPIAVGSAWHTRSVDLSSPAARRTSAEAPLGALPHGATAPTFWRK